MKNRVLLLTLIIVFAALPMAYLAIVYPGLPETVSVHFGLSGKADRFGARSSAWLSTGGFGLVSLVVCLILLFISKIDPKQATAAAQATQNKIAVVLAVFMCISQLFYDLQPAEATVAGIRSVYYYMSAVHLAGQFHE